MIVVAYLCAAMYGNGRQYKVCEKDVAHCMAYKPAEQCEVQLDLYKAKEGEAYGTYGEIQSAEEDGSSQVLWDLREDADEETVQE